MNYQFLLMRHARSRHNREKDLWKERYNDKSYKQLPEYESSKFSPLLIDSSQVNQEQCQIAKTNYIDPNQIDLVICSPLRRCLQTCKEITSSKKNIKVIVEPMLCSRVSAAWSICSSPRELQEQYPNFDFTLLKEVSDQWMLRLISAQSDTFISESQPSKNKSTQEHILQLLKNGFSESYSDFFKRTRNLKKRIRSILSNHLNPSSDQKKILVISHSCVLSFLLGSELTPKGKIKDKISFPHCIPASFSCQSVICEQPQASL